MEGSGTGVLFSTVMRRDGGKAEDGYTYSLFSAFTDKEAYIACADQLGVCIPDGLCEGEDVVLYEGKLSMVSPTGA